MVRKTSDEEARVMQEKQALATIRKINRKLQTAPFDSQYRAFLLGCRDDIVGSGLTQVA